MVRSVVLKCSRKLNELLHFGDEDKLMATHAALGEFESTREDWTSYTERLEQYFLANDVDSANSSNS